MISKKNKDTIFRRKIQDTMMDVRIFGEFYDKNKSMDKRVKIEERGFGVFINKITTSKTKESYYRVYVTVDENGKWMKLIPKEIEESELDDTSPVEVKLESVFILIIKISSTSYFHLAFSAWSEKVIKVVIDQWIWEAPNWRLSQFY